MSISNLSLEKGSHLQQVRLRVLETGQEADRGTNLLIGPIIGYAQISINFINSKAKIALTPMTKPDMALPLFSGVTKSAIVPPPFVNGALPKTPARNLNPTNIFKFVARAHPMLKAKKDALQKWYTGNLP